MSEEGRNYLKKANEIADEFINTVVKSSEGDWKEVKKYEDDGISVFARDSTHIADKLYKSEFDLDVSAETVLALCDPSKAYRITWDPFLEKLEVAETIAPNVHIIYHATKPALKGMVSGRDTIDLVKIGCRDNYYYVVAASVDYTKAYLPNDKYKRNIQHPAGYVIYKNAGDPNKCKFVMVFHTDLDMNKVAKYFANAVKPTLMSDKMRALKKATETAVISKEDMCSQLAP